LYRVEFAVPENAPRGLTLSIETLMDNAPKAIGCSVTNLDDWGDANLYVACGFSKEMPSRYALLFWDESGGVNAANRAIMEGAFLTVFASPEHLKREKRKWTGTQWPCPPVAIPPAVDDELFTNEGGPRSGAVWAGPYEAGKGLRKAIDWACENKMSLDVYGIGRPFLWLRRYQGDIINLDDWDNKIRIWDEVSHLEMPEIYNRHKVLVSLPMWFDPCPRACIEASMCGCRVVTNRDNGFASWDGVRNSSREFWDKFLKAASSGG